MLELVFALGILSFASGAVMTTVVAGAAGPVRAQHASERSTMAMGLLNQAMAAGSPTPVTLTQVPGNPDFNYQVKVSAATFDANVSILEVSVVGITPGSPITTLRGTHMSPSGAAVLEQFGCLSCHGTGPGASPYTPALAPNLTVTSMEAGRVAENLALGKSLTLDEYIEESIRVPNDFVVPGWTPAMSGFPNVAAMPQADLNAMRTYIKTL